jgi:tetratricopeptide (TPR) repeat protein
MIRSSLLIAALMAGTQSAVAQIGPACAQSCSQDPASCHYERSQFLLTGHADMSSPCMREFEQATKKMDRATGLDQTVQELDQAIIALPPGSDKITTLKLEKAAALIALARMRLQADDLIAAEVYLSRSADVYKDLLKSSAVRSNDAELRTQIAVGLLRCGRPLEALATLKELPPDNGERMYLRAEIFFALGEREEAASAYETWIAAGCVSELPLLSQDEWGEKWAFAYSITSKPQTKCQQLPSELRSRLDTLREEFGHPGNLPKHQFPGMPLWMRID